jgi:hypothetical protein
MWFFAVKTAFSIVDDPSPARKDGCFWLEDSPSRNPRKKSGSSSDTLEIRIKQVGTVSRRISSATLDQAGEILF